MLDVVRLIETLDVMNDAEVKHTVAALLSEHFTCQDRMGQAMDRLADAMERIADGIELFNLTSGCEAALSDLMLKTPKEEDHGRPRQEG